MCWWYCHRYEKNHTRDVKSAAPRKKWLGKFCLGDGASVTELVASHACVRAYVRACMRVCVRAVHTSVRACVHASFRR
jgi:hypothetical protein